VWFVQVVVATAVIRDGAVLAAQRSYPAEVAGRWELPGGRVEPGESEPDAVVRECREELAATVVAGARIGADVPVRDGMVLRLWSAGLAPGSAEPVAAEHLALRWTSAAQLGDLDWLDTDRALLPALARELAGRGNDQPPRQGENDTHSL
jgi:8-oxo-dGTP diphosphatase